ncbi:MAG: hypothetical protein ABI861_03715 [Panacibacter sp.]
MYRIIKIFIFCFSIFWIPFLISCSNNKPATIETNTETDLPKTQPGDLKYYLRSPNAFEMTEGRGKEGQLGYNIIPKDTSSKMFAFIEIEHGRSIGDAIIKW